MTDLVETAAVLPDRGPLPLSMSRSFFGSASSGHTQDRHQIPLSAAQTLSLEGSGSWPEITYLGMAYSSRGRGSVPPQPWLLTPLNTH